MVNQKTLKMRKAGTNIAVVMRDKHSVPAAVVSNLGQSLKSVNFFFFYGFTSSFLCMSVLSCIVFCLLPVLQRNVKITQ